MQYLRGIEAYHEEGRSAVTFGKFDGLHCGHQKLVDTVKDLGGKDGIKSIVCAFDMMPIWEKQGVIPRLLMTKEERKEHLEHQVDYLVNCPFSEAFGKMEAEDFIRCVVHESFHASYVVVGTDFGFGHEKRGDIHMLEAYASQYDYELIVIEKERYERRTISSTYIRQVMEEGKVPLANKLLGYTYGMTGIVEHGRKLGRTLGFPTFNVTPEDSKLMPPKGVYLNRVFVEGKWYNGIANIGVKPTVTAENKLLIESYLFDYSGDAYGLEVKIELLVFVRPEQRFANVEEMKGRIGEDIAFARKYFFTS